MGKKGSKFDDIDYTTTDSENDPDWLPDSPHAGCGGCGEAECEECYLLDNYSTSESSSEEECEESEGEAIEFNFQRVLDDRNNDIRELKKIIKELSILIMNCECSK